MANGVTTMSWTAFWTAFWIASRGLSRCGGAILRLLALLGFGLMLGACTKCDVPTWQHSSIGDAPAACHDSPAPQ